MKRGIFYNDDYIKLVHLSSVFKHILLIHMIMQSDLFCTPKRGNFDLFPINKIFGHCYGNCQLTCVCDMKL